MITASGPSQPSRLYLVERYLAASAAPRLPDVVARLAQVCEASQGAVAYLHSTFLPAEDTCFCLFRAAGGDAVRAVNAQAGFGVDRITDAVLLHERRAPSREERP